MIQRASVRKVQTPFRWPMRWVFVAVLLWQSGESLAVAELSTMSGDAAVEAAAEGLKREARFPWYDAQSDELRPLQLREKETPTDLKDWAAKKKVKKTKGNWDWFWDLFPDFNFMSGLSTFMQLAVYGLLIALLLIAIYILANSETAKAFFNARRDEEEEEDAVTDEQRMDNLPFDIRRPRADLLSEARRLYEAGRYGEAIVYLFSYQLLQLDKNQWIRLAKGKTNRQYLREIRHGRDLRGILQKTMVPFEDFFFGHYQIEKERFESCWSRLDEFHQLVNAEVAT